MMAENGISKSRERLYVDNKGLDHGYLDDRHTDTNDEQRCLAKLHHGSPW